MPVRDGLRLAVGTLTVVPAGPVTLTPPVARSAVLLAPVATVPLAALAAATGLLARGLGGPDLLVGLGVVGVLAAGSRALHLDGLADTADGLGAGWDAERSLAVMRRGDVGPMGVVTLLLVLGAQAAALGEILHAWADAVLVAALACASRGALVVVCLRGVPAARPDGLGAAVAGTVPRTAALAAGLACVAALAGAAQLSDRPWWCAVAVPLAAVAAVGGLVRRCVRRLGGVTGDVMGAAVEVALTVLVVGFALC